MRFSKIRELDFEHRVVAHDNSETLLRFLIFCQIFAPRISSVDIREKQWNQINVVTQPRFSEIFNDNERKLDFQHRVVAHDNSETLFRFLIFCQTFAPTISSVDISEKSMKSN